MHSITTLNHDGADASNADLKSFESKMQQSYPLGADSFKIDHGDNYFKFFKRLGYMYYYLIKTSAGDLVGTGCSVLRTSVINNKSYNYWYLCDLKVDPAHRGKHLSSYLIVTIIPKFIFKSRRGYLITMNNSDKTKINPVMGIFNKINSVFKFNISFDTILNIYSLNREQLLSVMQLLVNTFGPLSVLSLRGIKDIVLTSTNAPMNLYHIQHGPNASLDSVPMDNIIKSDMIDPVFMFCCPVTSELTKQLNECGNITTNVTATIVHYNMEFFDWHNILTSEI